MNEIASRDRTNDGDVERDGFIRHTYISCDTIRALIFSRVVERGDE